MTSATPPREIHDEQVQTIESLTSQLSREKQRTTELHALLRDFQESDPKSNSVFEEVKAENYYLKGQVALLETKVKFYSKKTDGKGEDKLNVEEGYVDQLNQAWKERDEARAELKLQPGHDAILKERNMLRERVEDLIVERDTAINDLQTIVRADDPVIPDEDCLPETKAELVEELARTRHALRATRMEFLDSRLIAKQEYETLLAAYHAEMAERDRINAESDTLEKELEAALHVTSGAELDRDAAGVEVQKLRQIVEHAVKKEGYTPSAAHSAQIVILERQLAESQGLERKAARSLEESAERDNEAAKKMMALERKVKELEWEKELNVEAGGEGIKVGRRSSTAGDHDDYPDWLSDLQTHVEHLPSGIEAASRLKGPLFEWIKDLKEFVAGAPDPSAFEPPKDNQWLAKLSENLEQANAQVRNLREKNRTLGGWHKHSADQAKQLESENLGLRSKLGNLRSGDDPTHVAIRKDFYEMTVKRCQDLTEVNEMWNRKWVEGGRAYHEAMAKESMETSNEEAEGVVEEQHLAETAAESQIKEHEEPMVSERSESIDIKQEDDDDDNQTGVRRSTRSTRNPQPRYTEESGGNDIGKGSKKSKGKKRRRESTDERQRKKRRQD